MNYPNNAEYLITPASNPIIIHWDDWPNKVGQYVHSMQYAIGLPHKLESNTKDGIFVLIRPEFRIYVNGEHSLSSICECHFKFASKFEKPINKDFIFSIITDFVHQWYSDEFLLRTNHKLSLYYNLEDSKVDILEAAQKCLNDCGW